MVTFAVDKLCDFLAGLLLLDLVQQDGLLGAAVEELAFVCDPGFILFERLLVTPVTQPSTHPLTLGRLRKIGGFLQMTDFQLHHWLFHRV
jgi:hypothetical protein